MGEIKNQDQFNEYLRKLPSEEKCGFMIHIGINLCNDETFKCPYRGKERYSYHSGKKKECEREKILKLKKLL